MNKAQLAGLSKDAQVEILANEGIIYLVRVIFGDQTQLLKDDAGKNQIFKSATAAGAFLAGLGFEKASVVHQCAYDEVIGHEPGVDTTLKTPMDLVGLKPLS